MIEKVVLSFPDCFDYYKATEFQYFYYNYQISEPLMCFSFEVKKKKDKIELTHLFFEYQLRTIVTPEEIFE